MQMVTTIINMADNNTFSFNMCNVGIISDFKKKTQNFSNSVKQNTLSTFEFIALNIVSATFLLVCFLSLNKSTCQTRTSFCWKMKFSKWATHIKYEITKLSNFF